MDSLYLWIIINYFILTIIDIYENLFMDYNIIFVYSGGFYGCRSRPTIRTGDCSVVLVLLGTHNFFTILLLE
jgi:hypothetical protein